MEKNTAPADKSKLRKSQKWPRTPRPSTKVSFERIPSGSPEMAGNTAPVDKSELLHDPAASGVHFTPLAPIFLQIKPKIMLCLQSRPRRSYFRKLCISRKLAHDIVHIKPQAPTGAVNSRYCAHHRKLIHDIVHIKATFLIRLPLHKKTRKI